MDSLALDQMLSEYQEKVAENVAEYEEGRLSPSFKEETGVGGSGSTTHSDYTTRVDSTPPVSPSEEVYEANIGGGSTIPVRDQVESVYADSDSASGVSNEGRGSREASNSSSSSSYQDNSSNSNNSSFYLPSSMCPTINYERDAPHQKLIAVFGREFDGPNKVADSLQRLVSSTGPDSVGSVPSVKFVPFMLKRKTLLNGSYSGDELKKHDLICMCYNASEARLLLTGTDGFYTSLLRHTEFILGSNKVSFLITSYYNALENHDNSASLISPSLKTRLYPKESLRVYLDGNQVLSWMDGPSEAHAKRLVQLADLEINPQNIFSNQCSIL